MKKGCLTTAWHSLVFHEAYSAVTIFGLAISIRCNSWLSFLIWFLQLFFQRKHRQQRHGKVFLKYHLALIFIIVKPFFLQKN